MTWPDENQGSLYILWYSLLPRTGSRPFSSIQIAGKRGLTWNMSTGLSSWATSLFHCFIGVFNCMLCMYTFSYRYIYIHIQALYDTTVYEYRSYYLYTYMMYVTGAMCIFGLVRLYTFCINSKPLQRSNGRCSCGVRCFPRVSAEFFGREGLWCCHTGSRRRDCEESNCGTIILGRGFLFAGIIIILWPK